MIELRAGDLHLTLDPQTGGAIASFTHRGAALLRPVIDPRLAAQRGRAVALYPLVPYANRIAWCRFAFRGRSYRLARNFGDHPHAIHGNGWMRSWAVAEAEPDQARLTLDHTPPGDPAGEWPFAYRAALHFALRPDGLALTMSVQNRDTTPWPAGLGLHPYVARASGTALRFEADTLWTTDPDSLPDRRIAVQGEAEFACLKRPGMTTIDACYAGWGGNAEIVMPDRGVTLTLSSGPPMDHLQLYTPEGRDFIGIEPVSNMPDAINRMDSEADHGLRVLAPGETLTAVVRIGVRQTAP